MTEPEDRARSAAQLGSKPPCGEDTVRTSRRRGAVVVALAALQAWSCGSEELPPCPTGSCELPGRTVVMWLFNNYPERLFPNDTCLDMGASTVRAELTGIDDPAQLATKDVQCGQGQVSFLDLAPGMYSVAITPLDSAGTPIVKAPIVTQVAAGVTGADTTVTINVPYEAWTGTYTGTFLFRLAWAGLSCELTSPPVAKQQLKLTAGGQVVTALTDTGQKLDGTDAVACRALSEQFAQFAEGLPFGPATFVVTGKAQNNEVLYEHEFETFVGATKNNPTITFDVPGPDAGVDAPTAADAPID